MQSYPVSSTQGIPDKDSVFFHWDGQCNWVTCTLGREQMQVEAFTYNVCQVAECYLTEKELEPERWGVTILGQISNTMPVSIPHTQIYTSLLACPQKLPRPHDIFLVRRKQLPVPLCNTRCCYFISSLCFTCSLRKNKGAWMSTATTGFCI